MARKGNPISVSLNRSSDSSFSFKNLIRILKKAFLGILRVFRKFLISAAVLFTTQTLFSFFLTWFGPDFLSPWLMNFMDKIPLSVGSGGGGVGPSNRPPLDLNLPPAPEPEPEPEPASSSKQQEKERLLQEAREELKVWETRLKAWEEEERGIADRRMQSRGIHREIQRLQWKIFFSEIQRHRLIRAIYERIGGPQ